MQRYALCMLRIAPQLSALDFSRDFKAVLRVWLRRCRPEIWLRFLRKKPEPSLQQQPGPASDQLHQLHPISETRIPATHLLIAVHAVHR